MSNLTYLSPPLIGLLGLVCAFLIHVLMTRYSEGEDKIKKIADAIHEGAMVFMHREYLMLLLFAGPLFLIILISPLGWNTAMSFAVGAFASAAAGYLGMFSATKANVRTTTAAQGRWSIGRSDSGILRRFHHGSLRCLTRSCWTWFFILVLWR